MGLHRLLWIPKGIKPQHGVYVRYNAEELYAILSLESHRHQATLIGENLGTVPASINSAMSRHNIQRMYVVQYELNPNSHTALRTASPNSLASMNTHDMRPFGSFWEGHPRHMAKARFARVLGKSRTPARLEGSGKPPGTVSTWPGRGAVRPHPYTTRRVVSLPRGGLVRCPGRVAGDVEAPAAPQESSTTAHG